MNPKQSLNSRFHRLVDLPGFMTSWIDRFYEPREIDLVLLLAEDVLSIESIKARWEAYSDVSCPEDIQSILERSYKRGVLQRHDRSSYSTADFHSRYDIWALFEGWLDIPDSIRESLNRWELDYYEAQHDSMVTDLRVGNPRDTTQHWPEYLLLNEAELIIESVDHIYLWPCNCRLMMGACRKPIYTCLRFSNNRDIGWEISKDRAREILKSSNQKGLMQSGELSVSAEGKIGGAICNCCTDCCYPHILAKDLGAEKLWPLTRYVANLDAERCTACGRCVRRCPFDAFSIDSPDDRHSSVLPEDTQQKPVISFNYNLCRGCGVCSTGCRERAITMIKLDDVNSLYDSLNL